MEEPKPLLQIKSDIAAELAGYLSIRVDLQYVVRVTHVAVEFIESGNEDDFTLPTYLSAALVAYARPFSDGVRGKKKLNLDPKEVYKGVDGAQELHDYLIAQRNKLIAHSVNPYEDVSVGVVLNGDDKPTSIGYLTSRLVSFITSDYEQIYHLTQIALNSVNQKIDLLHKQLFHEVGKYTSEELQKLTPARYTAPHPSSANKPRRRSV